MDERVFIYALTDPITNKVKYIGVSKDPESRYKAHLGSSHHGAIIRWNHELWHMGLKPGFQIIDIVLGRKLALRMERDLVRSYGVSWKPGVGLLNSY